ncbi:MAG: hypothetical protein R3293_26975 [Candidatus Promineifilaceae bacterium]|nr:hypothetical protein [Candidatus Promineifilaceae bacterium]
MPPQSLKVLLFTLGFSLFVSSASHAFDKYEPGDSMKALGLEGSFDYRDQYISKTFNLNIPLEKIGNFFESDDKIERRSARVAYIKSCYDAAMGRYHSEQDKILTKTFSDHNEFDMAMNHFTAMRKSSIQFDYCSRS